MYLTATRPDIMYTTSLISTFMKSLKSTHWQASKRILRYVARKIEFEILSTSDSYFNLTSYVDNDSGGNNDDRKNTSGYAFNF